MNYLYSQAQVADYSEQPCLDSGPSDTSNGMITARGSLPQESRMESSPMPPFSAISKHSSMTGTPQAIRDWLMSLPPDSPVNRFPSPGSKREPMTSGICGRQRQSALELSAPDSFCLKTCREFAATCPWLSETCAGLGMWFQGPLSLGLTTLGRRTEGNGCGYLLGTPTRGFENGTGRSERFRCGRVPTPTEAINMLRTPSASDARRGVHPCPEKKAGQHSLVTQIGMLPTPRNCMTGDICEKRKTDRFNNLETVMSRQLLPIPAARDYRSEKCLEETYQKNARPLSEDLGKKTGLKLQPAFVEWMMGWPLGWTDLKPLEMAKFREWLNSHGKR